MQSLALEFGMSPATLRRRFQAAIGLSPKAFQLRLRIDRAKQLLTTSDLSIEAISNAVGIEDAFYFSRTVSGSRTLFAERLSPPAPQIVVALRPVYHRVEERQHLTDG